MKILRSEFLIKKGAIKNSEEFKESYDDVEEAIRLVVWPPDSSRFTLFPEKKGNGVVPIKKNCMTYLQERGWRLEYRMRIASRAKPGPIDAVKRLTDGRWFAVEWETGNISSSHRAMNKMAIGLLEGILAAGILVLPSRNMYRYLTDRVGNYQEMEPYFPLWRKLEIQEGVLAVIEIEHDGISVDVSRIVKGTDGRALR